MLAISAELIFEFHLSYTSGQLHLYFFSNSSYGKALPVDSGKCRQVDMGTAEEAAREIKQRDVKYSVLFKFRFLNLIQGR